MSRYIDADALYKKAAEWEAQALHMVEKTMNDEEPTEWEKWSTILAERSAFKFDVADAPTVDAVPVVHGEWIIKPHGTYGQLRAFCSACGKHSGIGGIVSNQKKPYCPNCGAIMDAKEIVDG